MDGLTLAALTYLTNGLTRPVVDGLGEMLRDQLDSWRALNLHRILQKANGLLSLGNNGRVVLNPKIVFKIAELGSLDDDPKLQDMWAGLLTTATNDDSNLHYIEIMSSITGSQALIIEYICQKANLNVGSQHLIEVNGYLYIKAEDLMEIAHLKDMNLLDQALDDLSRKGLTDGGFYMGATNDTVRILPRSLLLHFFAKARGEKDVFAFYKLNSSKQENKVEIVEPTDGNQ